MSIAESPQDSFNLTISSDKGMLNIPMTNLVNLYFIEDIYSMCITGRIKFIDNGGILEFGPFTGNEYFSINWGIEGETQKSINLLIYKVNKIQKIGESQILLDLFLTDQYYKPLYTKPHSYTFNDDKISKIVKDMGKLYLNINEWNRFENSKESIPYYYTGMKTPGENIKWLLSRASGVKSNSPGYLMFNTTEEKSWNLCTLEYLLSEKTSIMCEPEGFNYLYTFHDDNMYYINKILEQYSTKPDQNSLKKLMGGRKLGFDSSTKTFLDRKFSFKDALKIFTILGRKTLFQKQLELEEVEYISDLEGENDVNILDNIWYDNWIKQYCLQQTFSFVVVGHVERSCGKQIEVEWPSSDEQETMSKQFLGRYLIKSITHQFSNYNNNFYTQKLICIKNGYQDSDSDELILAQKKNLG